MPDSTVTVDTGEWIYVDSSGVGHTVTNAQTFTLSITDGGVSAVEYNIPVAQSMTTTDGLTLNFRPETDANNNFHTIHFLTDAGEGSDFFSLGGELVMEDPQSGTVQRWRVAKMNPSNADFNAAGTITMTLEDQFGHQMVVPATGSGLTVGQAA